MKKLIQQYADKFGENFPLFMLGGMSDEELKAVIEDCLAKGEPYQADDKGDDILY